MAPERLALRPCTLASSIFSFSFSYSRFGAVYLHEVYLLHLVMWAANAPTTSEDRQLATIKLLPSSSNSLARRSTRRPQIILCSKSFEQASRDSGKMLKVVRKQSRHPFGMGHSQTRRLSKTKPERDLEQESIQHARRSRLGPLWVPE